MARGFDDLDLFFTLSPTRWVTAAAAAVFLVPAQSRWAEAEFSNWSRFTLLGTFLVGYSARLVTVG